MRRGETELGKTRGGLFRGVGSLWTPSKKNVDLARRRWAYLGVALNVVIQFTYRHAHIEQTLDFIGV